MTNTTFKSPLALVLLVTATLLAVVGHHAATAQDDGSGGQAGYLPACFMNCRFLVISCTTGCRFGAGPFPFNIRLCLNQCSIQNSQCLASCVLPRPPPRRPILPPIFHRPPGSILPPIFHRPPGSILPPIFHRPPGSILPPIFHRPPGGILPPIEPHPIPFPPVTTSTSDPLPSSSAITQLQTQPPAQVDQLGNGN